MLAHQALAWCFWITLQTVRHVAVLQYAIALLLLQVEILNVCRALFAEALISVGRCGIDSLRVQFRMIRATLAALIYQIAIDTDAEVAGGCTVLGGIGVAERKDGRDTRAAVLQRFLRV